LPQRLRQARAIRIGEIRTGRPAASIVPVELLIQYGLKNRLVPNVPQAGTPMTAAIGSLSGVLPLF
jgi:hypothetical protein